MFLFLLGTFGKGDEQEEIQAMIKAGKFRPAYERANSLILKTGLLDADSRLFFLRGQCGYRINKYEETIKDLTRFLSSGSGNTTERQMAFKCRGEANLRLGLFEDAASDVKLANENTLKSLVTKAVASWNSINALEAKGHFKAAYKEATRLLSTARGSSKVYVRAASLALKANNETAFTELSNQAIILFPKDPELLELRGRYFLCEGEIPMAIRHFRTCRGVSTGPNCTILYKAANSYQDAVSRAQKFMESKNSENAIQSKQLIESAAKIADQRCPNSTKLQLSLQSLLARALVAEGKTGEAKKLIDGLLETNPNASELLCDRGDISQAEDDLDEAMKYYQRARKAADKISNALTKRAEQAIEKVAKKQDAEKNVDFYEVLNISKGAGTSTIKSAYKKAVVKWHPDRYRDPVKKREAERKMKNVNRAYDVLSDPEKRRIYDMGQDPDNPGAGQQQQGGGFQGGFPGGFNIFNLFQQGGGGGGGFQGFPGGNFRFEFH